MEFLSVTNKKTHLHKSPADLSIIATYEHDLKGTVSTDISLFGNIENSFVQIYKTNILEVLRLKKTEHGAGKTISRSKTSNNS